MTINNEDKNNNDSKISPPNKTYTYTSKAVKLNKRDLNILTDIDDDLQGEFTYPWIKWCQNSCRYDAICTVFTLCLLPNFKCFGKGNADKRNKNYKNYIKLCDTAELLLQNQDMVARQNIIKDFWLQMYNAKVDDMGPGSQGFAQQLLHLFEPLLNIQPFLEEIKYCHSCGLKDKKRLRWQIPMKIHDCNHLRFQSLQRYFDWYLNTEHSHHCEVCLQQNVEIKTNYLNEPDFIIIDFIGTAEDVDFQYNETLENQNTNSRFELVATVNMPTPNHFNCCIKGCSIVSEVGSVDTWHLHDGLRHEGGIVPLDDVQQIWDEGPFLMFYRKL